MKVRYLLGTILAIPLLPVLYFHARRIRSSVPRLPEASGTNGKAVARDVAHESLTLLTLGESTIAGVGVKTHQEGFTGTLADELSRLSNINIRWSVYARSGYTAGKVLEKVLPKITASSADLIVIGLGANDAFRLNSPARWARDVDQLIKALKEKFPSAVIVFCNMPPIREFPAFTATMKLVIGKLVEWLGESLQEVVKQYDRVYYFNEVISMKVWIKRFHPHARVEDFFSDGVHPSPLTYQTWAKDVAQRIHHEGWLMR